LALQRCRFLLGYPTRPVRLLVGFAAGGPLDLAGRLAAQVLQERLGQPFVVENKPGASINLATETVVRANPDGYTLLVSGAVNTWNTTLYDNLSFDFAREMLPVAGILKYGGVMVVSPDFPARTVPRVRQRKPWQDQHGISRSW
jgi:tripartite-type tricarboxylate transporter receptor subunit TctC